MHPCGQRHNCQCHCSSTHVLAQVGRKGVVFVDDLNMPSKEKYGAQPPIELLRQWMDHSGWYDRSDSSFRELQDLQFIAAMGPPGGGRSFITQRYVRHFTMLLFTPFSDASLCRVFETMMNWFFTRSQPGGGTFAQEIKGAAAPLVLATVELYNSISERLLPTPTKSHYLFNLRDISKVFQGIQQASAAVVKQRSDLVRLWSHECSRVFADRLVDAEDRLWFHDKLASTVGRLFNADMASLMPEDGGPLLFGNYLDPTAALPVYQV